MFPGLSGIGNAEARLTVDTSQLIASIDVVQKSAEMIRDAVINAMSAASIMATATTQVLVHQNQQIQEAIQKTQEVQKSAGEAAAAASGEQVSAIRAQIRTIDAILAESRAKLADQQKDVTGSGATGIDRQQVDEELSKFRDDVNESMTSLKVLKTDFAQFLQDPFSGEDPSRGLERLNDIVASYRGAIERLGEVVRKVQGQGGSTTVAGTTGLTASVNTPEDQTNQERIASEHIEQLLRDRMTASAEIIASGYSTQQQIQSDALAKQQVEMTRAEEAIALARQKAQEANTPYYQGFANAAADRTAQAIEQAAQKTEAAQAKADQIELESIQRRVQAAAAASEQIQLQKEREAQAALDASAKTEAAELAAIEKRLQAAAAASVRYQAEKQKEAEVAVAAAAKAAEAEVSGAMKTTQAALSDAQKQLSQQTNRFSSVTSGVSGIDTSGVQRQLEAARAPILDLQQRLAELKTAFSQAMSPTERTAALDQLNLVKQAAIDLAAKGFPDVGLAIDNLQAKVIQSTTGLQGFFTRLRENLEKLNESSLVANLQELSFRLAPIGFAASAAVVAGTQVAQTIQEMSLKFNSFTGSEAKSVELMNQLVDQAAKFGFPMTEVLTTMQRFAPTIREAGGSLTQVMNLAGRILTQQPDKGFTTAIEAITKGLGGTERSLLSQFHILPDTIKAAEKETGSFLGGLDLVLNRMGATTELAQQFGDTNRSALQRAGDAWTRFEAEAMTPFLDGITAAANRWTDVLNTLNKTPNILTQIFGGVVTITSALFGIITTLSQVGLAFVGLKAVIAALGLGDALAPIGLAIGAAISGAMPAALVTGIAAVAGTIGSILATAFVLAIPVAIVAAGVALGAGIVALATGTSIEEQFNRLKEILFSAISALAEPFLVFVSVFKNVFDQVGNAIDLFATAIAGGANDLGIAIVGFIRSIGNWLGPTLDTLNLRNFGQDPAVMKQNEQSRFIVTNANGSTTTMPAPGMQEGGQAQIAELNALLNTAGNSEVKFVEGYVERFKRIREELAKFDIKTAVLDGIAFAQDRLKELFATMFPQSAPTPETAGGGGVTTTVLTPFQELEAYLRTHTLQNLIRENFEVPADASDMIKDFVKLAQTEYNNIQQRGQMIAAFMTQQSRTLEDRQIAQAQAMDDFTRSRTQAIGDFYAQLALSDQDYLDQRAQKLDDFNRQTADAQAQVDDQKTKQQVDFDKQELRRYQDFIKAMTRMSRGIDDAISARDFLSAQKIQQQMADAKDDYDTETARRREDFDAQLKSLQDNLDKQTKKRKDDFDRQLQQADRQQATQRARQIAAFNQQLSREDAQRALAAQRQAAAIALQEARQAEDFKRQYDALSSHNDVMNFIFKYGLNGLEGLLEDFFTKVGNASNGGIGLPLGLPQTGGIGGAVGDSLAQQRAAAEQALADFYRNYRGPGGARGPAGFSTGDALTMPRQGATIIAQSVGQTLLKGRGTLPTPTAGAGPGGDIHLNLTINNAQGLDERKLVDLIKDQVVEDLKTEMKKRARERAQYGNN